MDDETTSHIPLVFLTARAELRDRAKGLELGGIDYITKPFNPVELASGVQRLLDRVRRGEGDELRRRKDRGAQNAAGGVASRGTALAAREVGGRHAGAAEAAERAGGDPDSDVPKATPQERLAMRRTAEPHPHDRSGGAVGSHAPRDRLTKRPSLGAVPSEPAVPVSVGEVARAQDRVGVRAGRALECRADSKRRCPMPCARPVDRAQEARFLTRKLRMANQA